MCGVGYRQVDDANVEGQGWLKEEDDDDMWNTLFSDPCVTAGSYSKHISYTSNHAAPRTLELAKKRVDFTCLCYIE